MLQHQLLVELGLSGDAKEFKERLVTASHALDFGLVSAVAMRRTPLSPRPIVRWIGNTPDAWQQASGSEDNARRDPVMSQLRAGRTQVTYDQSSYVSAGAGDLWEMQAPFGYRSGVASSISLGENGESFMLGVDRADALPTDPARCSQLVGQVLLITAFAQAAAQRVLVPGLGGIPINDAQLTPKEAAGLAWSADGFSVWRVADKLGLSVVETEGALRRATRKLGERSLTAAQLRVVKGLHKGD